MAPNLMIWGLVVFALLVVGLVLTVREFRELK
jgi:predicted nucleic acid-binding Zn ribbon protein